VVENQATVADAPNFQYSVRMSSDSFTMKAFRQADYNARWEAVATAHAQELAAMSEERASRLIFSLRLFAPAPPDPRNGMGLVEQQAIFHGRRL
jgi:hypothetical protein